MQKINEIKEKIKLFLSNLKVKITPKLLEFDTKFEKFMPNQKLRKIVYIATGSLFGFMLLIIILGIMFSPMRNAGQNTQSLFRKPNIVAESPKTQIELNENQKQILLLKGEIEKVTFPDSLINIPVIESKLSF